jgi:FlaA1/EpsC-like NDP-sugar epimerase
MTIMQIAEAIRPGFTHKVVGIRPGEKLHEQMIGPEDAPHTYEYEGHFKIIPAIHNWSRDPARIKNGRKVPEDFRYASDNNTEWMDVDVLRAWIDENRAKVGRV